MPSERRSPTRRAQTTVMMTGMIAFVCPVPSINMTQSDTVFLCIPARNAAAPMMAKSEGWTLDTKWRWNSSPAYPPREAPVRTVGMNIPWGMAMPKVIIMRPRKMSPTARRVAGSNSAGLVSMSLMLSSLEPNKIDPISLISPGGQLYLRVNPGSNSSSSSSTSNGRHAHLAFRGIASISVEVRMLTSPLSSILQQQYALRSFVSLP
mmetsp:Transcript_14859/g.30421  ORF Transcript_14859/g.30421 Transcript_14859/m.30421 type:complete len:207 (-) Transcript_14859:237-857(-)